MRVTYKKLWEDSRRLSKMMQPSLFTGVFGIPKGGVLPAYIIADEWKIPLVEFDQINEKTLIVDDLVDSGATINHYKELFPKNVFATVYRKMNAPNGLVQFTYEILPNEWIELPHEEGAKKPVEENIVRILEHIGEDANREGLRDTPKRVVKSYTQLFSGYKTKVEDILTVFDGEQYDNMVLLKDIEFYSFCEHHMLPFFGKAHVAYIPNEKIVGISKLARIVDIFSKRLQNQERLTMQIATAIEQHLKPKGVAVVMTGSHFCMRARGVGKQNSQMTTAQMIGAFKDQPETRAEFYQLIQ